MGPVVPKASGSCVAMYSSLSAGVGGWNVSDFLKNGLYLTSQLVGYMLR